MRKYVNRNSVIESVRQRTENKLQRTENMQDILPNMKEAAAHEGWLAN